MKEAERKLVNSLNLKIQLNKLTLLDFIIFFFFYLKLTEACQTKAKRKNKIGIIGKTSTNGLKGA